MKKFRIYHRDKNGAEHEYEGIFECSIEAIKDCVKTFGIGAVKVVAL